MNLSKSNIVSGFKIFRTFTNKHSPEILTAIGIAGMITTVVMAVNETPKAILLLDDAEKKKQSKKEDPLTKKETIQTVWKCYIPSVITGAVSIACLIGANSVNTKRNAALTAAYGLTETAFSNYKEQVLDTVGEKKEKDIHDKTAKKRLEEHPVSKNEIIMTGKGNTLCFEDFTGRYFKSDRETIVSIVNNLNRRILLENYISLNDFFDEVGLPHVSLGDELGWSNFIDMEYGAHLADDGTPCLYIRADIEPYLGYDELI